MEPPKCTAESASTSHPSGGERPERSLSTSLVHLLWWARTHARVFGLLSAATTGIAGIAAAGAAAGVIGALVAGGLVICAGGVLLIAIPITGFTRDQAALVKKGQEVAATVEDVCVIMDSHAAAYNMIFRRLPTAGPFQRDLQALPQAGVVDGAGPVQASPQALPIPEMADRRHLGARLEVKPAHGRRHHAGPSVLDGHIGSTLVPRSSVRGHDRSTPAFWELLTLSERQSLSAATQQKAFRAGSFICRQGERADHVIIVKYGWARVYTEHLDGIRVIAERGPGDLIGERAVMMVRWRSATVVALENVTAFVIPNENFSKFLLAHPRVNALLENQVYQRLTEDRGKYDPMLSTASWTGQICPIVLTDITAFSSPGRNDNDRLSLRRVMYDLLPDAFENSGLSWQDYYKEDRGDGTLVVVPPYVPASLIVEHALGRLAVTLREHNQQASDALRMQLRVALHAGPVVRDAQGMAGNAINHTARLVQAKVLGRHLMETQADLGIIASAYVYDNVIKQQAYLSPAAAGYQKVRFHAKESTLTAWIHLAGARTNCALTDFSASGPAS